MKIKITVEYMPVHILVGGIILSIYGLGGVFIGEYKWAYALVFILGLLMLTSRHMVIVNTANKFYSDFYWVLGIKVQNYTATWNKIQFITLTSGQYSQQYGMYVRRFISGTIYKMYLVLDENGPVYIGQSKSDSKIRSRAKKIADELGVDINDKIEV